MTETGTAAMGSMSATWLCTECGYTSRCWHTGWRWVCRSCWLRLFGRDPRTGKAVA